MANKLLKTMTIDGTSMDIHDLPLGVEWFTSGRHTAEAGTWVDISSYTITKPGIYLYTWMCTFNAGTSTGTRRVIAGLDGMNIINYGLKNNSVSAAGSFVKTITAAQVPYTVNMRVWTEEASPLTAYAQITRLPSIDE